MGLASKLAAAQANQGAQPQAGVSGYGAPATSQQLPYPGQSQQQQQPPQVGSRPGSVAGPLAGQQTASIPYQNPASPAPGVSGYGARPQSGYSAPQQQPVQSPYGSQSYAPPQGPPPGAGYAPSQGAPTGYGAPQQQYQGGYGAPTGYGAPPQQMQQQQQQARPGGVSPQALEQCLRQCVVEQKIQAFYPPQALSGIAQQVAASGALEKVAQEWRLPMEIAIDLVKIALFDTVLFVDDSGSMAFEEGGSRIDDLKLILGRVAQITSIFDSDGISCRFMNSREGGDGLRSEADARALISRIRFTGLTPFGTQLNAKVIEPMVVGPARSNTLKKPVLIIAITDGQPAGEDRGTLFRVILNAHNELSRTRYGPDALSLQIAQVGNDVKARQFLEEIDSHPQIGGLVDCTSNYELEADEMSRARPPVDLTPELWLVKMLLGAIDDSYDKQDE